MPYTDLPFTGGFYQNRSLPISNQQCINAYVNINQGAALSDKSLFGTPGLSQVATSGAGEINRGGHVFDGVPYFVNGNKLYRLNSDDTLDDLGTITGSGRVWMADNGTQLCILVPGSTSTGYIFTTGPDNLATIVDSDFKANGEPQAVVYIDGYFLFTTDSKKFIISALNDGTSYDALDFGTAEADPDDIVAPVVFRNQLFIAGSETFEVFENVGGAGFPFQRVGGLFLTKGCFAPFSLIPTGETFYFIGGGVNESPSVWAFTGNGVQAISTDGIDGILQDFSREDISDAFAWTYSQAGARFVGFTFPSTSLVFDLTSKTWHERRSQIINADGVQNLRWRANSLVTAYNKVLVGDSQDGRIGEVSLDYFMEYSQAIIREISSAPFSNASQPVFVHSLESTTESGVGDFTTTDPQIRLSFSKDGKVFSDELTRSVGAIGEYSKRQIWRRLGRFSRLAVFKFTFSDPVKFVLAKVEANIEGGTI